MDPKTHIAALCAGILLGGVAGWTLAPATAPVEQTTFVAAAEAPVTPPAPAPQACPTPPDAALCQATLSQVEKTLGAAQRDKEAAAALSEHLEELLQKSGTREGIKQEWPPGLDALYMPEGFTAAVDEIKKACPEDFPAGTKADCSEFPCSIQLVHRWEGRAWDGVKTCAKFKELLGDKVTWQARDLGKVDGKEYGISSLTPSNDQKEIGEFARDRSDNIRKRGRVRMSEFDREQRRAMFEGPCRDGSDPGACMYAAEAYREGEPDKYVELQARGCELGNSAACNSLAWTRCHDEKKCDADAIAAAERAAELSPDDGQGALDTLAYVLCAAGNKGEANAAYERSCAAGGKRNCGKKCGQ